MAANKDTKGRVLKSQESQMPDGRYRYRYTDKFGNRHAIYSWKLVPTDKTPIGKKEDICLREKIKKINKEVENGIVGTDMITDELIETYLSVKGTLSKSTVTLYKGIWEKHIKGSWLGKIKIVQVKKTDILKFYSILYKEKGLSAGTIGVFHNLLLPAFQLAVDDELIGKNPCKNCTKEYSRRMLSVPKQPLTAREQAQFLSFIRNSNVYSTYYVLFSLLLGTGLRISEALGLTWDDIDLKNKIINVNHQILYRKVDGEYKYYATTTKTKRIRSVPLQPSLANELSAYKQQTFFLSKSSGITIDGYTNFIFMRSNHESLYTQCQIYRIMKQIINANNKKATKPEEMLPDSISPHTLRHTYCTRMAENGIDIKVLQEVMGHANITMTMQVYNHVDSNRVQKEFEQLKDVLEA